MKLNSSATTKAGFKAWCSSWRLGKKCIRFPIFDHEFRLKPPIGMESFSLMQAQRVWASCLWGVFKCSLLAGTQVTWGDKTVLLCYMQSRFKWHFRVIVHVCWHLIGCKDLSVGVKAESWWHKPTAKPVIGLYMSSQILEWHPGILSFCHFVCLTLLVCHC